MFPFTRRAWVAAATVFCALPCTASAQTREFSLEQVNSAAVAAPPYSLFEFSTLTGSGNTITATLVPVVTSTGAIVYKDVILQFNADAGGNLTLASGFPKVGPSPTPLTSSFKAGRYVGPSTILGGKAIINVSGPGVTNGGATEWTLSAGGGADPYTYPASATWYVGPIASSPLAARLKAAGITSTAWYYGVASAPAYANWYKDTLIGVSQVGNALTIVSFSTWGVDSSLPLDQITYTLAP
jgi:hypothetical protein